MVTASFPPCLTKGVHPISCVHRRPSVANSKVSARDEKSQTYLPQMNADERGSPRNNFRQLAESTVAASFPAIEPQDCFRKPMSASICSLWFRLRHHGCVAREPVSPWHFFKDSTSLSASPLLPWMENTLASRLCTRHSFDGSAPRST